MKTEMKASKGLIITRVIALTIVGLYFGIMVFSAITGMQIPDAALRFMGIVDLIALPTAVFCSVRLRMGGCTKCARKAA